MAKESTGQAASKKQIIMVAVALATLLGVVYFMFLRGGEEPASSAAPAPDAEATPAEEEPSDENKKDEADAPKKKGKGPIQTSEVFGGKDPFDPVIDLTPVVAAAETVTEDATTDTTASTDDGTGTTPTTPTAPTTPTTPTVPAPPTTPPPDDDDEDDDDEERTGWSVKLVLIYDDNGTKTALVNTVKRETNNRQQHEVQDGERFRKHFKLTSMENRCATFLFDHEWFALCEGQRMERH
jgi:hypothetical protein